MAPDGETSTPPAMPAMPPIPPELRRWLRDRSSVRPGVVDDFRARLLAGERRSSLEVADALLQHARCGLWPANPSPGGSAPASPESSLP
jgi:hypothetical protein